MEQGPRLSLHGGLSEVAPVSSANRQGVDGMEDADGRNGERGRHPYNLYCIPCFAANGAMSERGSCNLGGSRVTLVGTDECTKGDRFSTSGPTMLKK